ncbi:unnamed protein product [Larinioides sclopetarius]|uniref:Uncharacterized protein n=1 Tax=Larinioides sclopetarius TaxID=280406 RepID=A0AAV1YWB9_9ARAC
MTQKNIIQEFSPSAFLKRISIDIKKPSKNAALE